MRRYKACRYASSLLVLLLALSFASFAPAQEKKSLRTVFVSLSWNNQLPFRIAIAKGFFKDQGLAVEPIFVRGGPTALAALISGDVDFASVGGAQAPIRSRPKAWTFTSSPPYPITRITRSSAAKKPRPSKSCAAKLLALPAPEPSRISPSGSISRDTIWIPTRTSPCAPSGEPHYAPSPSSEV